MPSLVQPHSRPMNRGRIDTSYSRRPPYTGTSYFLEEGESEEDDIITPLSKPSSFSSSSSSPALPRARTKRKRLSTDSQRRRTTPTMTVVTRDSTLRSSSASPPSPPPEGPPPPLPSPPPPPPPPPPSIASQPSQPAPTASGNVKGPTTEHLRRSSLTVGTDQLLRTIRERSRDSYQKIKGFPVTKAFQYAVTPSAPSIQTFQTNQGRSMHSIAAGSAPTIHSGPGYADASPFPASRATCGASYVRELKRWMYNLIHNFQMNLSVGSVEELRRTPAERTLRIKNNKAGCCIFEVTPSDSGDLITPIQSLKHLFPQSKYLQKSLTDWNRHFQSPPAHWVINFIPRAYLRRGYYLAEDVCEYLMQHPDGCRYKVEYEPIGHDFVLVGTVAPRGPPARERNPSRYWEGKEKRGG